MSYYYSKRIVLQMVTINGPKKYPLGLFKYMPEKTIKGTLIEMDHNNIKVSQDFSITSLKQPRNIQGHAHPTEDPVVCYSQE